MGWMSAPSRCCWSTVRSHPRCAICSLLVEGGEREIQCHVRGVLKDEGEIGSFAEELSGSLGIYAGRRSWSMNLRKATPPLQGDTCGMSYRKEAKALPLADFEAERH
jgi:hypothetical protein